MNTDYLNEQNRIEAREIADLILEGNNAMARENFAGAVEGFDALQRVAFLDEIKANVNKGRAP